MSFRQNQIRGKTINLPLMANKFSKQFSEASRRRKKSIVYEGRNPDPVYLTGEENIAGNPALQLGTTPLGREIPIRGDIRKNC